MDGRSVLIAQIDVMKANLRRAEKALNWRGINPDLKERAFPPLSNELQEKGADLENLRQDVVDGLSLDICWDSFRSIREKCEIILRECLDFIQGALVRHAQLDDDLCRVADALLIGLGHDADIRWERFTMLAGGEFIVDLAQVIRLRFSDLNVWTLPIAAHEFGHFIGPEIDERGPSGKTRHPFEDLLEKEGKPSDKSWAYLHERFADIFATYALGPSFACASILLRFDPRTAYQERDRHPSDAERVFLILRTLERLDEENKMPSPIRPSFYRLIAGELEKLWQESLIAVNRPPLLDQTVTCQLETQLDTLYALLKRKNPNVRYKSLPEAVSLSEQLEPDQDGPLNVGRDTTLPDALNAAWYCRLQHWNATSHVLNRIETRATDLCFKLVPR